MSDPKKKSSFFSRKLFLGTTIAGALFFMLMGVVFLGGFNTAMKVTSTTEFCNSCHSMKQNIYDEYIHTAHYRNRSGVQASCSDCHVPDPWIHKMVRKIKSTKEVLDTMRGVINTPEKFEQLRMQMASRVWKTMKATDSRECRSCHNVDAMELSAQSDGANERHQKCVTGDKTCIDCHKGIAHTLPKEFLEQEHERFVLEETPCEDCHVDLDI